MIRDLRLRAGLTLRQLAESCGVSHAKLQAMERGTSRPLVAIHPAYCVMAEMCGASVDELRRWAIVQHRRWDIVDRLRDALRDPDLQLSAELARRVLLCQDSARLVKIAEVLDEMDSAG